MAEAVKAAANNVESKQYIVVVLGSEHYGVDINYIDNIVRMQSITRVPKTQTYFEGVINLRGEVIPVMSLRKRFGLEADEITGKTRILILKPEAQGSIGIIVDSVKEVLTLSNEEIDKPSAKGADDDKTNFLTGVGKNGDELVSILNIMEVIQDKEEEE
ncbi:MAG: chemotaxis protein CheW [Lachnospiraceae bacterium]|nr:chemotaxis protein CheW [Lachnospiraceae bacterium]